MVGVLAKVQQVSFSFWTNLAAAPGLSLAISLQGPVAKTDVRVTSAAVTAKIKLYVLSRPGFREVLDVVIGFGPFPNLCLDGGLGAAGVPHSSSPCAAEFPVLV